MTTTKKSDSDSIESDDRSATMTITIPTGQPATNTTALTVNKRNNNINNNKNNNNNNNTAIASTIDSNGSSNNNNNNNKAKSCDVNNKTNHNDNNNKNVKQHNGANTDTNKSHNPTTLLSFRSTDNGCKYRISTPTTPESDIITGNGLCEYDDYPELLHYDDCKLEIGEDDKDSLVGMSASEDEDDAEIREVVNGELREIDNTSDLTSSPPPPHLSHSNCTSPVHSPHNSLLSLNSSPDSSSTSSESGTDSGPDCSVRSSPVNQPKAGSICEPYPIELAIGCCRLCCPNRVHDHQDGKDNDNNCDHLPLIPHYPPTVSSIRNAVSHITRLDDFNVVKLSHGFFSQVFKVVHFGTKRVLVLKMNKDFSNRGNALKEIELLNKLNHENIVAFMGTVVHEGALHPLLEYINGGTLEQLIKQFYNSEENLASQSFYCTPKLNVLSPKVHRLEDPDRTFVKLMFDVSKGMDYLHKKGYIHRDLASKNIFIRKLPLECLHNHTNNCDCCELCLAEEFDDRRLVAVIGDFGFATHEPEPDHVLSTVGSPYWLAPECLKNSWYNHKCDVYSFGIVCCELNWRIPADPDYLPRSNDFAVDFTKLNQKRDNLLGRVAQLACQANPLERPEFEAIRTMLRHTQEHVGNGETSLPDRNNNRLYEYLNKQTLGTGQQQQQQQRQQREENATQSVLGANGSVLGATNKDTSIMLAFEPEMRDHNEQCLSPKTPQTTIGTTTTTTPAIPTPPPTPQQPSLVALPNKQYSNVQTCQSAMEHFTIETNNSNSSVKFNTTIENDIFDQHLLRRHLSSFSTAPFVCSCSPLTSSCTGGLISSPPSTKPLDIAPGKRFPDYHYSHHHHHHPYLHYHQQQIQQQEKQ